MNRISRLNHDSLRLHVLEGVDTVVDLVPKSKEIKFQMYFGSTLSFVQSLSLTASHVLYLSNFTLHFLVLQANKRFRRQV